MKYFSHFRFDQSERKLWTGSDLVPLTRKAADLLACLVSYAGATVSHQKLMQWVWPETHVQQDNIKVLVHELRQALGDSPATPRFIGSESGRGYAFIAAVADAPCPLLEGPVTGRSQTIPRDQLLGEIEEVIERAISQREPAYLFLEGMAGSGKTSACREIHRRAIKWPSLRSACGRGHRTSLDVYPAMLEMLDRLVARYPALVRPILARRAPTWLSHIADRNLSIGHDTSAATMEAMAFELVDAFGELGQEDAFFLVLEDLHWSGPGSLDLLSLLASEAIPSRIVLIGTYAPFGGAPAERTEDPISRLSHIHGRPARMQLLPFAESQVKDYLEQRFGNLCSDALAGPIYSATMGHAASVARVTEELVAAGFVRQSEGSWNLGVRLRRLHPAIADAMVDTIRTQLDGLRTDERRLLSAAAGVGWEFTDKAVADALGIVNDDAFRSRLDLMAMHLPVFERLSALRGSRPAHHGAFRFRHRQWFDVLRGQATMAIA
jgi:DNA-binding winged helix-turn-helix (wHTH) protein